MGSSGTDLVGFESVEVLPAVGLVNLIPSAFGLWRNRGSFCKLSGEIFHASQSILQIRLSYAEG
jgi:hypothetical protein